MRSWCVGGSTRGTSSGSTSRRAGSCRRWPSTARTEFAKVEPEGEEWEDFVRRLSYRSGDFGKERSMEELRDHLDDLDRTFGTAGGRFYYCATPPAAYPEIVSRLAEYGLHVGARIVVEKPFGYDLESAKEL